MFANLHECRWKIREILKFRQLSKVVFSGYKGSIMFGMYFNIDNNTKIYENTQF